MMVRIARVLGASLGLWLVGCGGGAITSRDVDTPAGSIVSYGAPADPT